MARRRQGFKIPRWMAALAWPTQVLLVYVLTPATLAEVGPRYGWHDGWPGPINAAGLVMLVPGLLGLGWLAYRHLVSSPKAVSVPPLAPDYLLTEGAYRWSRNPMYVAGVATWMGWTVYYGSLAVMAGTALAVGVITCVAVPYEERSLEARFGESYARYKASAPRWLGLPRSSPGHDEAST